MGILHFSGAASWLMKQAIPELKVLSILGYVFGYLSWVFKVSGPLPSPLNPIVLVLLIVAGVAIALAFLYIISEVKKTIRYYFRD